MGEKWVKCQSVTVDILFVSQKAKTNSLVATYLSEDEKVHSLKSSDLSLILPESVIFCQFTHKELPNGLLLL